MLVTAEFTTEPFLGEQEAAPPAAVAAYETAVGGGLAADFGPFGSSVTGAAVDVFAVLPAILEAAFDAGATRVTVQVSAEGHES